MITSKILGGGVSGASGLAGKGLSTSLDALHLSVASSDVSTSDKRISPDGGGLPEKAAAVPEGGIQFQQLLISDRDVIPSSHQKPAVPSGGGVSDEAGTDTSRGESSAVAGTHKKKKRKTRKSKQQKGHGPSGHARRDSLSQDHSVEQFPPLGEETSRKRGLAIGETPDSVTTQQRKAPRLAGPSIPYASAASKSLQMAIVIDGQLDQPLTSDLVDQIQADMLEKLLESANPVQFESSGLTQKGVFRVTCSDESSKKWLQEIVPSVRVLEGLSLVALGFEELQRMNRVAIKVPKITLEPEKLKQLLAKQNPGLDTAGWVFLNRVVVRPPEKGEIHYFTADGPSLQVLETRFKFRPHFGMTRIAAWPLSRSSQGEAGPPGEAQ